MPKVPEFLRRRSKKVEVSPSAITQRPAEPLEALPERLTQVALAKYEVEQTDAQLEAKREELRNIPTGASLGSMKRAQRSLEEEISKLQRASLEQRGPARPDLRTVGEFLNLLEQKQPELVAFFSREVAMELPRSEVERRIQLAVGLEALAPSLLDKALQAAKAPKEKVDAFREALGESRKELEEVLKLVPKDKPDLSARDIRRAADEAAAKQSVWTQERKETAKVASKLLMSSAAITSGNTLLRSRLKAEAQGLFEKAALITAAPDVGDRDKQHFAPDPRELVEVEVQLAKLLLEPKGAEWLNTYLEAAWFNHLPTSDAESAYATLTAIKDAASRLDRLSQHEVLHGKAQPQQLRRNHLDVLVRALPAVGELQPVIADAHAKLKAVLTERPGSKLHEQKQREDAARAQRERADQASREAWSQVLARGASTIGFAVAFPEKGLEK